MATRTCASCGGSLHGDPFFELVHKGSDVGGHCVCVECFGVLQAKRGCTPSFSCPSCDGKIIGHHCWKKTRLATRNRVVVSKEVQQHPPVMIVLPTDYGMDPCRYFLEQPKDWQSKNLMLSIQWMDTGNVRTLVTPVPFEEPCDKYPDDVKGKLVHAMTLLYHVFFYPADADGNERRVLQSIYDIEDFVVNDQSLLTQAIIGLATGLTIGKLLPNGAQSNTYQRSSYIAFWVAIEMMRRGKAERPGILQDLMQHHLTVHAVHQDVKNVLCKFRIAASRNRARLKDIDNVNQQILTGWDLNEKRHWVLFVMYDNLGFRIRGARAGYDQYTMVLVSFISPTELAKVGFYKPAGSIMPPISRTRLAWSNVRHGITMDDRRCIRLV